MWSDVKQRGSVRIIREKYKASILGQVFFMGSQNSDIRSAMRCELILGENFPALTQAWSKARERAWPGLFSAADDSSSMAAAGKYSKIKEA
jgi:hypothetical protein